MMGACFALSVLFMLSTTDARGLDFKDVFSIGAAYTTHLLFHEMGHQVVADKVGADSPKMYFFTIKGGKLYPGLSTYKSLPEESKLPYAVGGDWMAGHTFEFALQSYHRKPTTYNKALMFFSCADFLAYTLLGNYVNPENKIYDPNVIRAETGLSKEALLSLVTAKTLINTYRIIHKDAKFIPIIWLDKTSAAFMIRFSF